MAFCDFRYPDVLATFGLTYDPVPDLFSAVADSPPARGSAKRSSPGHNWQASSTTRRLGASG